MGRLLQLPFLCLQQMNLSTINRKMQPPGFQQVSENENTLHLSFQLCTGCKDDFRRVDFKNLLITFKAQNGLVPSYISDLLTLLSAVTGPKVLKCCSSGGSLIQTKKQRSQSVCHQGSQTLE